VGLLSLCALLEVCAWRHHISTGIVLVRGRKTSVGNTWPLGLSDGIVTLYGIHPQLALHSSTLHDSTTNILLGPRITIDVITALPTVQPIRTASCRLPRHAAAIDRYSSGQRWHLDCIYYVTVHLILLDQRVTNLL
jgi:hypothetical protein